MKSIARRVSVLVFVLAMAVSAFADMGDCPNLYMSTDGGCTWSVCNLYGAVWDSNTTLCYYTC